MKFLISLHFAARKRTYMEVFYKLSKGIISQQPGEVLGNSLVFASLNDKLTQALWNKDAVYEHQRLILLARLNLPPPATKGPFCTFLLNTSAHMLLPSP